MAAIGEQMGVSLVDEDRFSLGGGVSCTTIDEVIDSCASGGADDWAFWVYLCGEAGDRHERDRTVCARAVHLQHRSIGLVWSPASEDETASLPAMAPATAGERHYFWVGLLCEGSVVDGHLAVWVDGAHAPLPVPFVEQRGDGRGPTLWVSRRAHRLVRLASEVDPDSSDFDACFADSGIELR